MRFFGVILIIATVCILAACKSLSTSKNTSDLQPYGCEFLVQKDKAQFGEMTSLYYTLDTVYQAGDMLHFDISTPADITRAALYWTGRVRQGYPAQASVKLMLYGEPNTGGKYKQHSLCYDVSIMEGDAGERINIYIMDDEISLDFYFQQQE